MDERLQAAQKWGATPLKLHLSPADMSTSSVSPYPAGTSDQLAEFVRTASAKNMRSGSGADAVIECVGAYSALEMAYDLVATGGTISSVGVHHGDFPFTPPQAYDKNITYRAGRCPARSMMPIAEKLLLLARQGCPARGPDSSNGESERPADGRIVMKDIITHRFHLRDGKRAYDVFDKKVDGCLKPVMYPEEFASLVH